MKIVNWFKSLDWKEYIICLVLVSIGAFFIHLKQTNGVPELNIFFSWLPVSWLLVFVLMCGFSLLVEGRNG